MEHRFRLKSKNSGIDFTISEIPTINEFILVVDSRGSIRQHDPAVRYHENLLSTIIFDGVLHRSFRFQHILHSLFQVLHPLVKLLLSFKDEIAFVDLHLRFVTQVFSFKFA